MVRRREDGRRRADLHHAAEVEDGDPVGEVADDAEVVRDEEVGDALLPWRSTSRFRIAAWTDTSRAEVGSSQTTTRGSPANARAMATRCFRPPESWRDGRRAGARRSGRPRELAHPGVAALAAQAEELRQRPGEDPAGREARLRAESGFWKTIWRARTSSVSRSPSAAGRVAPSSSTVVPRRAA